MSYAVVADFSSLEPGQAKGKKTVSTWGENKAALAHVLAYWLAEGGENLVKWQFWTSLVCKYKNECWLRAYMCQALGSALSNYCLIEAYLWGSTIITLILLKGKWRHGALSNLLEGTQLNSRVAGIQTQAGPQLGLHACQCPIHSSCHWGTSMGRGWQRKFSKDLPSPIPMTASGI